MRKKFKCKKKVNFNSLLKFLLILILIILLYYFKTNFKTNMDNNIVKFILKSQDNNINIKNEINSFVKNKLFDSPVDILNDALYLSYNKIEPVDLIYVEKEFPQVYIYNSHQGEKYSSINKEEYNIVPNVMLADKILKDKLDNIGITTIVEEANILKYMEENGLNHAGSYEASKIFLSKAIEKYPSVKLFIDLHRDAVTHDNSTTTINDKKCAKILFVIGLENSNYEKNLRVVTKLNNMILNRYPSLTRGILKKKGYGVNGVYNQDLKSNVILIEVGGNENNIEEVNNTLELLAIIIGDYINEKEEE